MFVQTSRGLNKKNLNIHVSKNPFGDARQSLDSKPILVFWTLKLCWNFWKLTDPPTPTTTKKTIKIKALSPTNGVKRHPCNLNAKL